MITVAGGIILALVVLSAFDNFVAWCYDRAAKRAARRGMLVLLMLLVPVAARGQRTMHVTMVDYDAGVAQEFAEKFTEAHETLWCVTSFTRVVKPAYAVVHVKQVSEVRVARTTQDETFLAGSECRNADGTPQPMIHSHPARTCQASPDDYAAMAYRMAPFDGIVCGERAVVWYFSRDIMDVWLARRARENAQ